MGFISPLILSFLLTACQQLHAFLGVLLHKINARKKIWQSIFHFINHVRYLIGCDNELAKLHTRHPEACDKVGGVIIMHIDDLRKFALMWLHKTEEVRADTAHYSKNITGDIYESGWISEMYGYSFGAAEVLFHSRSM